MYKFSILLLVSCVIQFTHAQVYVFHEPGKYQYGLKDTSGKIIVEPKYTYHYYIGNGLIKMEYGNNWTLFDSTGRALNQYDRIHDFTFIEDLGDEYAFIEKNYNTGLIDKFGKEIFPPVFRMGNFSDGLAPVYTETRKVGFIDTHGKLVIDTTLQYYSVGNFSKGLAEVKMVGSLYIENGDFITDEAYLSGYIDKSGKEVIPIRYQENQDFFKTSGIILALLDPVTHNYFRYVNVKPSYQSVKVFKGDNQKYGFKKTVYSEEYGLFKVRDSVVMLSKYDTIYQYHFDEVTGEFFTKGYFMTEISGKKGLVDSLGNEILPVKYDWIDFLHFGTGYSKVVSDGKSGLLNKSGKEILAPLYYDIGNFSQGLIAVRPAKDGRFGYVDSVGQMIIDTTLNYDSVGSFSDGMAKVERGGFADEYGIMHILKGYIDVSGKEVIPLKYTEAGDFKNGRAKVQQLIIDNDSREYFKELYIDTSGNEIK